MGRMALSRRVRYSLALRGEARCGLLVLWLRKLRPRENSASSHVTGSGGAWHSDQENSHIQSTFVLVVCYVPKAVIGAGHTKYKNFKTGAVSNLVGNWMRGTGFVKPVQNAASLCRRER